MPRVGLRRRACSRLFAGVKVKRFSLFIVVRMQCHEVQGPLVMIFEIAGVERNGPFDVAKLRGPVQIHGGVPLGGTGRLGWGVADPEIEKPTKQRQAQDGKAPERVSRNVRFL